MENSSQSPKKHLIEVLGSIAMYNDKGYEWSKHSPGQMHTEQQKAQAMILQLISEIGEQAFSSSLLARLKSGEASTDFTGEIADVARSELSG